MIFQMNKKLLEKLRNQWGKPIDKFRNFDLISLFHKNVTLKNSNDIVDEKTWSDLNFDDIFSIIDRNTSAIGQQYLYHILHKYEADQEILNHRIKVAEYFKTNSITRERIQLNLKNLDETNSYFVAPLIFGDLPERPKYFQLFWIFSYLAWISFALIFINGQFLFLALTIFLLNAIINHIYAKNIHTYFAGFSSINSLFNSILRINKLQITNIKELQFLRGKQQLIKKINKKIGSFVIDIAGTNEMVGGIIEYLNIYFLYDLKKFSRSIGLIRKYHKDIQEIFIAIAKVDCSISMASYLASVEHYCNPNFQESSSISFDEIYHPLIPNAVSNSLENLESSALITGSNMAGKTTFIKTVGVNFIFAQTLNICLSKSAIIPKLIVKSAIKREEDLENSKSYFFVEIEGLLAFIELSKTDSKYLFLIDEIFRGTNTIERLSVSTSVLEYLNKNNLVFVTTHDIELQEMLNHKFEMMHFSETVENNNFFFDYKLHNGPTSSGNAIKLLEIKGYPKSIIEKSNRLAKILIAENNL